MFALQRPDGAGEEEGARCCALAHTRGGGGRQRLSTAALMRARCAQTLRENVGEEQWRAAAAAAAGAESAFIDPSERQLALAVARVGDGAASALRTNSPHELADALFGLGTAFNGFYERCRIVRGENVGVRMRLCDATDAALRRGLDLLGVRAQQRL